MDENSLRDVNWFIAGEGGSASKALKVVLFICGNYCEEIFDVGYHLFIR